MRRNLVIGMGLIAVLLFGFNASLQAQAPTPPKAKHTPLERLRHAHRLLTEADHDYDGHRVRAVEEVHKAIKDLEGKHHPKSAPGAAATGVKPAAPTNPAVPEPQANSDAKLRKALEILQGVETELGTKHPKAVSNITSAIEEINTALGIK